MQPKISQPIVICHYMIIASRPEGFQMTLWLGCTFYNFLIQLRRVNELRVEMNLQIKLY